MVDAYWQNVPGGKPPVTASARKRHLSTPASEKGSKKRRQTSVEEQTPTKDNQINDYSWMPPKHLKSWEHLVAEIETLEKLANGVIMVYLHWYLPYSYLSHLITGLTGTNPCRILQLYTKSVPRRYSPYFAVFNC